MKTSCARLAALLLVWGLAASFAGAYHLLAHLPPRMAPLLIAGLSISFSISLVAVGWLREAMASLSVRVILAVHLVRFAGFYFLWLNSEGRLPLEFAQRAGWGDIVAASGALALLFWPEGSRFRSVLFWWNIIGATDLLLAVGTAGWLNATRPGSMIEISQLPLTLVPLWAVPVLLSSHIYLIRRSLGGRCSSGTQALSDRVEPALFSE